MTSALKKVAVIGMMTVAVGIFVVYIFAANISSVPSRLYSSLVYEPCPLPGAARFSEDLLPVTALVGFPGSGTRWTRHLLTTASGILEGTVLCNCSAVPILTKFHAVRVIGIKTQATFNVSQQRIPVPFVRGVVLVRSPYEAILANFNRLGDVYGGPTLQEFSSEKRFREEWSQYVSNNMERWPKLYKSWAASNLPIHVLTYSRMKSDLPRELDLVFQFLNVNANIHCALESPEGFHHRQKQSWQDKVAVFNETQVRFLNNAIDEVQLDLERKTGAKFDDFQAWKR